MEETTITDFDKANENSAIEAIKKKIEEDVLQRVKDKGSVNPQWKSRECRTIKQLAEKHEIPHQIEALSEHLQGFISERNFWEEPSEEEDPEKDVQEDTLEDNIKALDLEKKRLDDRMELVKNKIKEVGFNLHSVEQANQLFREIDEYHEMAKELIRAGEGSMVHDTLFKLDGMLIEDINDILSKEGPVRDDILPVLKKFAFYFTIYRDNFFNILENIGFHEPSKFFNPQK